MKIGIPKETKQNESRVGLTPNGIKALVDAGHECFVETKAGKLIGFDDSAFKASGASIVKQQELYQQAELIVKIKEPQKQELSLLQKQHSLFCYLHLAADKQLTQALMNIGLTAIAFETVTNSDGQLPLLAPMSKVAGRVAMQTAASLMQTQNHGPGLLMGGLAGVAPAHVVIIGGGVVGTQAAKVAIGLGAQVTILDRSITRLGELEELFGSQAKTLMASDSMIEHCIQEADIVIGAVLIAGAKAPKVLSKQNLSILKPHCLLVDVAIDQGGCFESSHATSYSEPIFIEEGIRHCCIANIPTAVGFSASQALENVTLPHVLELANKGIDKALVHNIYLNDGLNINEGRLIHPEVARAHQLNQYH